MLLLRREDGATTPRIRLNYLWPLARRRLSHDTRHAGQRPAWIEFLSEALRVDHRKIDG